MHGFMHGCMDTERDGCTMYLMLHDTVIVNGAQQCPTRLHGPMRATLQDDAITNTHLPYPGTFLGSEPLALKRICESRLDGGKPNSCKILEIRGLDTSRLLLLRGEIPPDEGKSLNLSTQES